MSDYVRRKEQSGIATATSERKQRSIIEKWTPSSDLSVYESSTEETVVRYKGTKASSVNKGSEEFFEYSCDPCGSVGDHVEAAGFCTNCEEYLCRTCFKSHKTNKVSQHHSLLDKDNMPRKYEVCDPCKRGDEDEIAVGYCKDCGEYLCSNCFKSHSKNKVSRTYELLDKDKMPKLPGHISGQGADSQRYNEEYTYIRDINVKAAEDEKQCLVSGMTLLSSTELILADQDNQSLKLVDLENNVIKHILRLDTFPAGLTTISENHAAVALCNNCKIQIISVSKGLSVERTLKTNGGCLDIKYVNGKLYVSFCNPVKIQILQLSGAVYKTIKPDSDILKHCTYPRYITVSPDESMIYISDWETNNVMSMAMNGNMISVYSGELDEPLDIKISPPGSVYLCNRKQHIVYKMEPDLSEATVILGRGDGLVGPQAMCFNCTKQTLYISSGSIEARYKNFLKVFEWK